MKLVKQTVTFILALSLTACVLLPEPHRIEIAQGNVIEEESVQKLQKGMSEEQVKFVLGSPALIDMFNPNRWDYIHYVDEQHEELVNKKLTLFFQNGLLINVQGDFDISHLK